MTPTPSCRERPPPNASGGWWLGSVGVAGAAFFLAVLTNIRPQGIAATIGVALFTMATAGMAVSGIFRTEPSGAPPSLSGLLDRAAVTASFLLELVAVLPLAMALRGRSAWPVFASLSLAIGNMAALAMLWLFLATRLDAPPGLAERAALLVFIGRELATGWRLQGADPSQRRGREAAHGH